MLSTSLKFPTLNQQALPTSSNIIYQIPHANLNRNLSKSVASSLNTGKFECELSARTKRSAKSSQKQSSTHDRKAYINSLLESTLVKRPKINEKETTAYTCDRIIEKINEKIRTSYHGLRHLFKTNYDLNKQALSRESFKHIIKLLCGYIPQDEWVKLLKRFNLDGEKDYLTFEDFMLLFYNDNEKVRKEFAITRCQVELIDLTKPTTLQDRNKNVENISATYAISLMKAKARTKGFNPHDFIPEKCFDEPSLILPHHLEIILSNMNLKLDYNEFKKLWERFDLVNIGSIKTKVFLRLINYNPNEINSISTNNDKIRIKSSIVTSKENELPISKSNILDQEPQKPNDDKLNIINDNSENTQKIVEIKNPSTRISTRNSIRTVSDESIKSIVRKYKPKRHELMPNDDIIAYLNGIFNEGYINFRTVFEFIDPDELGCLLKDEMMAVLSEFNIIMEKSEYENFLKSHGLLKRNELIDYKKFLSTFKDLDDKAITNILSQSKKKTLISNLMDTNEADQRLVNQFHGNFMATLNYFKNIIATSDYCPIEVFRKLIEQRFFIKLSEIHISDVLKFTHNDPSKNEINWIQFFKKLNEIE